MADRRIDDTGERTEQPTSLRLREARQRGRVARSAELTSAAAALGGLIALVLLARPLLDEMTAMVRTLLDGRSAGLGARPDELAGIAARGAGGAIAAVGGLLAASAALAVLTGLAQGGLTGAAEGIRPDFGRISPRRGLARLLSVRTLVRALLSGGKVVAIALAGYWTLKPLLRWLPATAALDGWDLAAEARGLAGTLALRIVLCLLGLAGVDSLYQRWQYRRDLRMTRREAREDLRQMEGDPQLRQRRRRIARELGDRRLPGQMSEASVVVVAARGPAVAIKYDETMTAPRVVARGKDWLALRIRRLAEAAGLPLVEDGKTAREIYRQSRAGEDLPEALYDPVARILAQCGRAAPGGSDAAAAGGWRAVV
jgi:flagellar biosynthetic protein FlhB